jgi:DNA adenine methylase
MKDSAPDIETSPSSTERSIDPSVSASGPAAEAVLADSRVGPKPFLKWAGSKRGLTGRIASKAPVRFDRYWEPFLGSGALFLHLNPARAELSDKCGPLIETWIELRDRPGEIIDYLASWRPSRRTYLRIRKHHSGRASERAAEFIFLNKTCWNGLYRVNSSGEFNVPFGTENNGRVYDEANLLACSSALRRRDVNIMCRDFEDGLEKVSPNDFVYFDPPYVSRASDRGFIDYNDVLFSWADQVRLARRASELMRCGARVLVTNANNAEIISLYRGFKRSFVTRQSTIASKSRFRKPVTEVILYSPNCIT